MGEFLRRSLVVAAALGVSGAGSAIAGSEDPAGSALWPDLRAAYLGDGPVVYDDALRIVMPQRVEDAANVPVMVKFGAAVTQPQAFILIAENNPIQAVTRITPYRPVQSIGFNIRLEQSTPVRAAALDADGIWHVATMEVVVLSPGGCSAAPGADAENGLGDIAMTRFERNDGIRLKLRINHPMHTGFAALEDGEMIPAYYIDRVHLADDDGPLADLVTWAALASDPTFIFDLPSDGQSLRIEASDSEGLTFEWFERPSTM